MRWPGGSGRRRRCVSRWGLALLVWWSVVAAPAWGGQVELRGLRLSATADATRAVLDLSGQVSFRLFTLADPARVVLDLRDARVGRSPALPAPLPHPVAAVRLAARGSTDLRLVFDLRRPVDPRGFLVAPGAGHGHRLVVELPRPRSGSAAAGGRKQVQPGTVDAVQRAVPAVSATMVAAAAKAIPSRGRDLVVAIDAGHGGKDPGAIGARGTREKDVVLSIAKRLAALVDAEPGMRAVSIRTGDRYLTLRGRILRARRRRADLFVSIHADAFQRRAARGASVFILSRRGASSEAARWLAAQENALELLGGVNLGDRDRATAEVLLDLSQTVAIESGHGLAQEVLKALGEIAVLHDRDVGRAGFLVLKSPDIPSILVETGFLSNPDEERLLRSPAHQERLAAAILRGLRNYFAANPIEGTWLASRRHVIVPGDTLSGLALRYSVSIAALRRWNGLESDLIRVGQVLRIPLPKAGRGRGERG